jgi:N-acyl-D-amino-acid deacylase
MSPYTVSGRAFLFVLAAALLVVAPWDGKAQEPAIGGVSSETLIENARVADGTGSPLKEVSVRIVGDKITAIGRLLPSRAGRVIDGRGLVLAPGFIDIHNHSEDGLKDDPIAETQISQGITTVVLGLDGVSPWPISGWLEERRHSPSTLNVAVMVGHATIRERVMGQAYRRVATGAEIAEMVGLVTQGMREGAQGLSSGLEYELASYSSTDEVVAMAAAAAKAGGFYMTHIRDEANRSFAALEEEIEIGERAHIAIEHSHIKLATVNVWGKAPEYIRTIEAAHQRGVDLLADCYPYDAWESTIKIIVPDKRYENPTSVEKGLADIGGASRLNIMSFPPNQKYEGRTLEELARQAGVTPVQMYIRIIREGDAAGTEAFVIGQSMLERDIRLFYQQPWVMVASDGGIGLNHPRAAGTFPRVLGLFVRERHWLTLPDAIRKMTSLPASRLGWKDRGVIRAGAYADLVLFNPNTVIDRATFAKPKELASGIEFVFVNGTLVWKAGRATGARPGSVIAKSVKPLGSSE